MFRERTVQLAYPLKNELQDVAFNVSSATIVPQYQLELFESCLWGNLKFFVLISVSTPLCMRESQDSHQSRPRHRSGFLVMRAHRLPRRPRIGPWA